MEDNTKEMRSVTLSVNDWRHILIDILEATTSATEQRDIWHDLAKEVDESYHQKFPTAAAKVQQLDKKIANTLRIVNEIRKQCAN